MSVKMSALVQNGSRSSVTAVPFRCHAHSNLVGLNRRVGMETRTICRTMLCAMLWSRAVSVCSSVRVSVTFMYSIKRINISSNFFHRRYFSFSAPYLYGNIPTGRTSIPPTGASNADRVDKNRDSRPISGFIACCQRYDRQVLYTQLRQAVASWQHLSLVSGVVCCLRDTVDEMFMTGSLKVTPKTTKQHLIVRAGKSEAAISNNLKKNCAQGVKVLYC